MNSIRIATASLFTLIIASCTPKTASSPDTFNPYGTADAGQGTAPTDQAANPIYDTPAAYEESGTASTTATTRPTGLATTVPDEPSATPPRPTSNGAAIIHTVVAGDTLSGISAKYKVSVATIKQANNMTKDTVVLGRKMVIPPAH